MEKRKGKVNLSVFGMFNYTIKNQLIYIFLFHFEPTSRKKNHKDV